MKNAIVTIAIGDEYKKISCITHESISSYADRIGADFIVIDKPSLSASTPHFEKFQLYYLLNTYKRIAFLDTDLIVREDCPDLFEVVPEDSLGAFNEGAYTSRVEAMKAIQEQYDIRLDDYDGAYFNTGVMVVSRRHKFLFRKPTAEISNFYEQSYLNLVIQKNKIKTFRLDYKLNRLSIMDELTGEHRRASHIVHYAGCPNYDLMRDLMRKDLDAWKKDGPNFDYKRNINIQVHGGLGDEVCAEPVIRYICEKAYPDANVHVTTWFPRLFAHLPVNLYQMGEFKRIDDTPYYDMDTMAKHGCPSWKFVSPNLCNTTDYSSLMCLRGSIPNEDKRITLPVFPEDDMEIKNVLGDKDFSKTVLVHPGRGWESKTFPAPYWEDIVSKLAADWDVVLIGKDVSDEQGVVRLKNTHGATDVVNKLSLGGIISLISKAKVLVSNDSAPVHIAGAFDTHIVLIPTCKHPDHVLPYRNGCQQWRTTVLCRRLMYEPSKSVPTMVHGKNIDKVDGDIMDYLPSSEQVRSTIAEIMG